jgi:hypothetical protein
MTMHVKIEKYQDDSWQARVRAVDFYADTPGGEPVPHVSDLGLLKKQGESVTVYCTSSRSLSITEEILDSELVKAEEPSDPVGTEPTTDAGGNDGAAAEPAAV